MNEEFVVLSFMLSLAVSVHSQAISSCSMPWFLWKNDSCKCGRSLEGVVSCIDKPPNVNLESCYCMTTSHPEQDVVVGNCPYTCDSLQIWSPNVTMLNKVCSTGWHRTGQLCSQCIDGYGPLVFSYTLQCVECSHSVVKKSIVFFLLSFLPLTVFCLTLITLRISVARPPMSTFVLVCQVMTSPQYYSLLFAPEQPRSYVSSFVPDNQRELCYKLFASTFGIWNLDIFRSFYPNMCLSPNMSTTKAHSLEFLVALFPLAVILITFILGNIHYCRGYGVIYSLCKPVIFALTRLRQTLNIQVSLVDALVTFIILSVIKVGYTSVILLQPVYVYTPYGNYTTKVYIDPSITYFGWDHLPYALAAIVLSVVLIVIPLLLLFLYPLRSFQRFLNNLQWQCSTLHIFADSFQGCYKNGTNGTRDYRWFAGLHLLLRFILVVFYDASHYQKPVIMLMTLTLSLYIALLTVCQPYKKNLHLKLDMVVFFGLQVWNTALLAAVLGYDGPSVFSFGFHLSLLILASAVSFFYFAGLFFHWFYTKQLHLKILIKIVKLFHRGQERAYLLDFSA